MIAVVTGSSGFIGSHLVERLLGDGVEVRCLVRGEGGKPAAGTAPTRHPRLSRHAVSYDDAESLRGCAALDGADVVYHLAGVTKARSARAFDAGNVRPTALLLDALRTRGLRPRFVLASSQAAAGPARAPERPVREDDVPRPVEGYGASKLCAESLVRAADAWLPATIVRPSAVYGPRDADFLPLFRAARAGIVLQPAPRGGMLSILHVRDAVDGIMRAGRDPGAVGETLFLAHPAPVSWRELHAAVMAAVGARAVELPVPQWLLRAAAPLAELLWWPTGRVPLLNRHKVRLSAQRYWLCDTERAAHVLGFRAGVALAAGIRETYLWYVGNRWLRPGRAGADAPPRPTTTA